MERERKIYRSRAVHPHTPNDPIRTDQGVEILPGTSAPATLEIRLYNLLFAEVLESSKLAITYAEHTSKTVVKSATVEYPVGDAVDRVALKAWVDAVMAKAYSGALKINFAP